MPAELDLSRLFRYARRINVPLLLRQRLFPGPATTTSFAAFINHGGAFACWVRHFRKKSPSSPRWLKLVAPIVTSGNDSLWLPLRRCPEPLRGNGGLNGRSASTVWGIKAQGPNHYASSTTAQYGPGAFWPTSFCLGGDAAHQWPPMTIMPPLVEPSSAGRASCSQWGEPLRESDLVTELQQFKRE